MEVFDLKKYVLDLPNQRKKRGAQKRSHKS
jgi:hypothetical protein